MDNVNHLGTFYQPIDWTENQLKYGHDVTPDVRTSPLAWRTGIVEATGGQRVEGASGWWSKSRRQNNGSS